MRRRALLRAAALAGAAGIAGCTSDGPSSDPSDGAGGGSGATPTGTPTDTPTDSPTDTPTDSPTDTPTATRTRTPMGNGIVGQSFEVTSQSCGQGRNAVDIGWDGQAVTLDGVIDGPNACYTAEQASVDYDPATDRMHVNIRSYEPEDAGMCAQCLVDIEYRARYVFEGETPEEVTVAHDGRDIATAGHGSSSASAGTDTSTSVSGN